MHKKILLAISVCLLSLTACRAMPEDLMVELRNWFQTPIPKSTLVASHEGIERIRDSVQAAIIAYAKLQTSRVVPRQQPVLVSVEQIDFETVLFEDLVQEEDVQWMGAPLWLVISEGDFKVTSPRGEEELKQGTVKVLLPEDASAIRVIGGS